MPFDINNPANVAALASEITNDPTSIGPYTPFVQGGNDQAIADILNFLRNGTTPCPINNVVGAAVNVKRLDVSPIELLEAIDTRDLKAAPTILEGSWLESIFQFQRIRLVNDDGTDNRIKNNLDRLVVSGGQGSQTRLNALRNKIGSRAETLFGTGSTISADAVARALGR